jgi:hypothetical protein
LKKVIGALDAFQIEYMLTGSFASSLQGEPRSTHDIDLIVEIEAADADRLVREFPPPDYYLSKSSMIEAIQSQKMFNLLDIRDGGKVDFWILTTDPFDQARFARRQQDEVAGTSMKLSSPEDTILAKLKWAQSSGGSEKQFGDALRVYEVQGRTLDEAYLQEWVQRLGLASLWQRLQNEAEIVELD